jgi:hypothetical protein
MSTDPTSGAAAPKPPEKKNAVPAPSPRPAPAAPGPQRPAIAGGQGKTDHMGRYLEMLGVGPRATLDEINTAYFTLVKRFPENPTEEDEARVQELRRAYDIVRRRYVPPKIKGLKVVFDKRVALPLMAVAVLALGGTFLWMNWSNVKLQTTHYDPGTVLRLKNTPAPYGTVTGYESTHRFPAGLPAPAYQIKLAGKEETVWVSERLVVLGMESAGN